MTSSAAFFRSSLLMLGLGILLLLGIVGYSLWLVEVNRSYSDETASLRRVRSAIIGVLTTVQDAETGQRGYLLSRETSYLAPYDKAVSDLPARWKTLEENLGPRPDYASQLDELKRAVDGKMAELAHSVSLTEQGRFDEAYALLGTDAGLQLMNRIREILNGFLDHTDDQLRVLIERQLSAADNLQWVTIGGAIAIFTVIGGAVLVIFQHVRDLARTREEVIALNAGLEERVNERTEDLIRANQEIQRFAYIVTHDLRAPLVNIMGFLSELETSLKPLTAYVMADERAPSEDDIREARLAVTEDLPEAMGFIRSSTRKMDALINAILKISRDGRRKLQPERIDVKALIETSVASVQHQLIEQGGKATISGHFGAIVTDRFSLEQIFGNLFDNAVKYQMPGRPLTLSIALRPHGPRQVRIAVTDNGRGIGDQDRERVFELFRRAGEQDQPGEGIGLAHVRSLIRNLGGDVTVESELGRGSTFVLTLPTDLTKVFRSNEQ